MVAEEFSFEKEENSALQDFDDAEETLSFCDLPLHNNGGSDWDEDFSKEDQRPAYDQDFFEFFSEDFAAAIYPKDNIIFCGKLIPYKGATIAEKAQNLEVITTQPKKTNRSCIFPWKSHSFNKSTTTSSSKQQLQKKKSYRTCKSLPVRMSDKNKGYKVTRKCVSKYDSSMKKVSILGSPMKSRWYLFAFGLGRFPTKMELSDMKTRQSKRRPMKMFPSSVHQHVDGSEMVKNSSGKKAKDLWGLLRLKVSFACIYPQI